VTALAALVEYTHRFIGTTNLHLQKECFIVIAAGADCHGAIDVLPGIGPSQDIIDYLSLRSRLARTRLLNRTAVGTSTTNEFTL